MTLEIEPSLGADNVLDLQLIPQVVEHLGWVDVENGKPVKSMPVDPKLREARPSDRRLRPVFSSRKATTNVSIFLGNSVVITNIGETEDTKPFQPKTPGRRLIVIVTARQVAAE